MKKILEPILDKIFKIGDKECYMYQHQGEYFLVDKSQLVTIDNDECPVVYIDSKEI